MGCCFKAKEKFAARSSCINTDIFRILYEEITQTARNYADSRSVEVESLLLLIVKEENARENDVEHSWKNTPH